MKPFVSPKDLFHLPNGYALIAVDDQSRQIVSVGWKETHTISDNGTCEPAVVQEPFDFEDASDPEGVSGEPEFVPYKLATDIVVFGSAWAPYGRAITEMVAAVQLGQIRKEVLVIGNRRCTFRENRPPIFSQPQPFETMPLSYTLAYGGVDAIEMPPPETLLDFLSPYPGAYPRNDIGKGYVIYNNPDRVEGLELPNLEDPLDRLTPERLIVGSPANWWKQPLPQCFGWFSPGWYPRVVHLGCVPEGLPDDDRVVPEVQRGYLPPGHKRFCEQASLEEKLLFTFTNGASPGLSVPYLRGDEVVHLEGMRAQGSWSIRLPGKVPEMLLRFEGKTSQLPVVPQTVLIETEEAKLTLVWRGWWHPTVQLPRRFPTVKNPDVDPLEGVEIFINGAVLH